MSDRSTVSDPSSSTAIASVLLLAGTAIALVWANSPWAHSYDQLWHTRVGVGIGGAGASVTLETLVNDVLMSVFFFGVGLELRHELSAGELRDPRRAALPAIAAVGGMLVPATIFLVFNRGPLANAWGIPIATDIAFALGVLSLLGNRVSPSTRVFLLALAIADDLGAILVIGIFYANGVQLDGAVVALLGIGAIILLQRHRVRRPAAYVVAALAVWAGVYRAGIHPTIAGAIVGLLLVPSDALQRRVQPWIAFAIMPVFALANAGVKVTGVALAASPALVAGIGGGLVLGKPVGIVLASMLAVRARIASLPAGLTWRGVTLVGIVAGIGFTMALFITSVALPADLHDVGKSVVLIASAIAALTGWLFGRFALDGRHRARRFIPELQRGPLALALLCSGLLFGIIELVAATTVPGRAVLFVVVFVAGLVGVLRRPR